MTCHRFVSEKELKVPRLKKHLIASHPIRSDQIQPNLKVEIHRAPHGLLASAYLLESSGQSALRVTDT